MELGHSAGSLSLFADRKLIEVQLPSGKPGTEGAERYRSIWREIRKMCCSSSAGASTSSPRRANGTSRWIRRVVPVWPVSPAELPGWIAARMKTAGLTADNDAVTLLAERLEGNLLAASQEIEKLRLLHGDQTITAELVADTVSDNARYDAFRLVDVALSGDGRGAVRTLRGLRAEAIQPPYVVGPLAGGSATCRFEAGSRGRHTRDCGTESAGVWRNRQGLVRSAMNRLGGRDLAEMQALSFHADGASKGFMQENPGAYWSGSWW